MSYGNNVHNEPSNFACWGDWVIKERKLIIAKYLGISDGMKVIKLGEWFQTSELVMSEIFHQILLQTWQGLCY